MKQQRSEAQQLLANSIKELTIYSTLADKKKKAWRMQLREGEVIVNNDKDEEQWKMKYDDMIGIHHEKLQQSWLKIKLSSFPRRKKCFSAQKRVVQHFQFLMEVSDKEFQEIMMQFLINITNRTRKKLQQTLKLLVYLNPNAGSNSRKHFEAIVDFLAFTNFNFDLVTTTHSGHCKDHLATVNPKEYEGVLIISGDGLMHQFVNSKQCGVIPVSHVPGGSGNGFAMTQMTLAGELCRDQESIFVMVKGHTRNLNLAKIQLQKYTEPIYSFLSLEWAFLADVDMNSQFLRCLGGLRFEVYSVYRLLSLIRYRGRLTYSTTQTVLPPLQQAITDNSFITVQQQFLWTIFPTMAYISDKYNISPLLKVEDQAIEMQYLVSSDGRYQLVKYLIGMQDGSQFDKEKGTKNDSYSFTYGKIKSYRLEPLGEGAEMGVFGIDGEYYQAQKVQVSLSDKKVLTFA